MSSTARLVVLDERDYESLKEQARRVKSPDLVAEQEPAEEPEPPPKEPASPDATEEQLEEPTEEPPQPPLVEDLEPAEPLETPTAQIPQPSQSEEETELQKLLKPLPLSGHQAALGLLKRLTSLPEFDFDPTTGQIKLNGRPVEGYALQKLLLATSKKSARNDLPQALRSFLQKNGIRKFRNSNIKLGPAKPWKSFHASAASTQRRGM